LSDQPTKEIVSKSESRFSYVYDEAGNWIELTVSGRNNPDEPFQTHNVETRVLAYWDARASGGSSSGTPN
jgi:hypothetical protein